MIVARSLRKSFGDLVAVDDVSFELRGGETFGLLGPNGAGKSTTINMLIGMLVADEGEVVIDGQFAARSLDARRLVGVAPQELALYEQLTGQENLEFFGRLYGLQGQQLAERTAWALQFAELADRRKDRVSTYSGGMKRRLNMAAALVHDPQIILFDEPTVGVDPQSRNHIFDKIEELSRQGRTMIYTTHYMEEAQRLCDRVAIMDHGKILDVDTVDDLIERHGAKAVVKAELSQVPADPQMLPGTLSGTSLRFESDRPFEEVGRLASSGVALQTLEVTRPDLESVFLTLTGRSLRD